ncbi:MAG: DUF402 domain-containing protein [Firmicutes bacterium]|nr:DUF402 domain-containing protein [Bacillota bacterium]
MKAPYTTILDRQSRQVRYHDGHSEPAIITQVGSAWVARRPHAGWDQWDLAVVLPERRVMASRIRRREPTRFRWYIDIVDTAPHPLGLAVTDWYLDLLIYPRGYYKVLDCHEFAAGLRAGYLTVEQAALAMEALHQTCEGLHRCGFQFTTLLRAWGIPPVWEEEAEVEAKG